MCVASRTTQCANHTCPAVRRELRAPPSRTHGRMRRGRAHASAGLIAAGRPDRTAARAAAIDSSSCLATGASRGGWTMMRTPRGMAIGSAPVPNTCVPTTEMGTIRTPARAAMVKGPFLKLPSTPSLERVPSGKVTRELPALSVSTASLSVLSCDFRSVRASAMCLAKPIAHPTSGMRRISILEMYLKRRGRKPESEKMSRNEQWFGTYITASPCGGRFSCPSSATLAPKRVSVVRAHHCTT
mmetsp:Transcript_43368/g.140666  ORF Transcript_43368/g.140666 Transcript_43368/m.140666 type:complete len:242 (+) Transcript_43368:112-837(+)